MKAVDATHPQTVATVLQAPKNFLPGSCWKPIRRSRISIFIVPVWGRGVSARFISLANDFRPKLADQYFLAKTMTCQTYWLLINLLGNIVSFQSCQTGKACRPSAMRAGCVRLQRIFERMYGGAQSGYSRSLYIGRIDLSGLGAGAKCSATGTAIIHPGNAHRSGRTRRARGENRC
jgi:hypothetical protein